MKITWTPICRELADWLNRHKDAGVSTIGEIGEELGLERSDYPKLWRCMSYWRKKFLEFYKIQDQRGILHGDPYQKWLIALENFRVNYLIEPLFFDKAENMYYTPDLHGKEVITAQRVAHWIKSGQSVAMEAVAFHETLPSLALPSELMGDLKLLEERVTDGDVPRCKSCGRNIQVNWVSCPSCGQPLQ